MNKKKKKNLQCRNKSENEEREENINNEGGEINLGGKVVKILLLFLQYCYSAILKIELHCSKYCKKFAILALSIL